MSEQDPLEELYDKVEELLRLAQSKAHQPIDPSKIPPDINQRLQSVNDKIKQFDAVTKQLVALTGTPKEVLEERLAGKQDDLGEDSKYLLNRGKELLKQVNELQAQLPQTAPPAKEKPAVAEEIPLTPLPSSEPLTPKKRKSKFKRFGINKDWKPL